MKNSEKFYGLAYKLLKYVVWLNIFVGVYFLGCIIGLFIRFDSIAEFQEWIISLSSIL